jgi:rhomboid family GlyGly-CTERM serine protease
VTRGSTGWLVLSAGLLVAATVGWFAPRAALDWQPALALAEPWRAWTAAAVHWSPWHLGINALGCVVVAVFGVTAGVPGRSALAWFAAWPLGHVALALQPALTSYGGLSGVLHAGVAVAAWHLTRHDAAVARRRVGALVLGGLAVKIALESPWGAPTRQVPGWDFAVAPLAHATGAVSGLVCAWLADGAASRTAPRRPR